MSKSIADEFEKLISANLHKELAELFGNFRVGQKQRVISLLDQAAAIAAVQKVAKKYNCTATAMYSYGKSHVGISRGQFDRYLRIHNCWADKINEQIMPYVDPMAIWNISRLPESELVGTKSEPGAVKAYCQMVWDGMEKRRGIYVRGQVITWDTWRWGVWHTKYRARVEKQANEGVVQVRTGRIVSLGSQEAEASISLKVFGTTEKKPTVAQARRIVKKILANCEIQFD